MLEKKSAKGDLDGKKTTFILIGFVFVLALVYVGFELFATKPNVEIMTIDDGDFVAVMDDQVQATDQAPPPAPPQQQQQEAVIHVVENFVQVNTDFDFSQDFDQNMAVEEYVPIDIVEQEVDNTPPLRVAEKLPQFPGGMEKFYEMLRNELQYPETARAANMQGTVVIEFVVEKNGSISNPKAVVQLFPDCDNEAIRALLKLPKWEPAEQMGRPVRCYFTIPVRFTLQ
ncbi:MAG: energy transducer TonB [Bacteroidales bacterium]|jgi:protein TonB|nr:energy transducer TonB [Bacteroidales bacterium]